MKQSTLKTALAAGIALLMPLAGYSQAQLGGTTADKKMQGNSSSGSAMGGLYTPSLYDGTANINIPIYQYSADGGNYGISLCYNTRGVKVDERAGSVGLHWNLNAGGSIQRVVKDVPDDIYAVLDPYIEPGTLILINPETKVRGRLVVYGETTTEAAQDSVYRDRESDDYIVSIGNLSFTFNLGKDGYVFTIPERNIKVELLRNGTPVQSLPSSTSMGTLEFRITDEQGNRYLFGSGDYRSESVKDKYKYDYDIGAYTYATSWVIKKVTTASGAEINYYYSTESHYASSKSYSDVQFDSQPPGGDIASDLGVYAKLDSISYPNGIMAWFKFDVINNRKDDFAPALREIQLKSNGQAQLTYKMNQSYLVASGLTSSEPDNTQPEIAYGGNGSQVTYRNYRLKLNGVSIKGMYTAEEPFYDFEYYDAVRLPKRFNGSQDYFGYYNGKSPVQYSGGTPDPDLSIPYHTPYISGSAYGVNRDFDINYAKAGVLVRIKNAFGGRVDFQYGANDLDNVLDGINTPGLPTSSSDGFFLGETADDGLRLNSTIEWDIFHTENVLSTIFTYDQGQRFISGGYFNYRSLLDDNNYSTIKKMIMTNQYVSRHQLVNGANHGYSLVEVKQVDENNQQLSRTEYTFTNFKDGNDAPKYQRVGSGSLFFFQFPYSEKQFLRDWEMGLPLTVKEYDQNNRITLETNNTYAFSIDVTSSAGKIENARVATIQTDHSPSMYTIPNSADFTDTYRPFRGKAQLLSSETNKYTSDADYINDKVNYTYDSHNNIVYTLAKNSKGEFFKTEHIYNYNLDMLLGSGLQAFTDAGLEKVVSTQRWKTDATGNTYTQLMDGFINTFDYSSQQVKPKAMYTMIPGDAISRNMYTGYSGSGPLPNPHGKIIQAFNSTVPTYFRKTSEVILSDAKGNPLESRLGDQDIFKAMIWDDVTGQKLAEAGSCHYADIAYCGFETPATGVATKGNVTYDASHVALFSGALYGKSFMLSNTSGGTSIEGSQVLTAGKEYILSFWANGTAPAVYSGTTLLSPVNMGNYFNSVYYQVRFTASANDKFKIQYNSGTGTIIDDVRLYPFTAQMQNWSYTPMFGAGISTDANGRPTFIEYDEMGRAKIARDKDGNIISKTEYGIQ